MVKIFSKLTGSYKGKGRGSNPKTWAPEVKKRMVETQKKVGHPWRRVYALSNNGISPNYIQK